MTIESLKALQKRIREATGPDRELDKAIWLAIGNAPRVVPEGYTLNAGLAPRYTTDPDGLGACVGLMREVLPGAIREVEATGKLPKVTIWRYHEIVWQDRSVGEHALETHATLLAICAALIAEEEAKLTEKADV